MFEREAEARLDIQLLGAHMAERGAVLLAGRERADGNRRRLVVGVERAARRAEILVGARQQLARVHEVVDAVAAISQR